MDPNVPMAIIGAAGAVGVLAYLVFSDYYESRRSARTRLSSLADRDEVMARSFLERALLPAAKRIGTLGMRFTPQAWSDRTRRRLVQAGWFPSMDEVSWAAIRIVAITAAVLGYFIFARYTSGTQQLILLFLFLVAGFAGPDQVLKRRVDDRVRVIERDLPDIIDLLVISIEAGLGFEAALDRVVRHVPGELSDEFARMLQETRVGVSRNDAMRALAERTDVDDLNSFVLAMNQADTFGVSIGRMLRVQSDEMRVRRRQRAQEKAFAAPVKMVFPLILCIFPSIFVILLGPAALNIFRNLT